MWKRKPRKGYPLGEWSLRCPHWYVSLSDKRCCWTRCDGECKQLFRHQRDKRIVRTVGNCKTCGALNPDSVSSAIHQTTTGSVSSPASQVHRPTNDHTEHASNSADNQLAVALRLSLQPGRSASRSHAVDCEQPEQQHVGRVP